MTVHVLDVLASQIMYKTVTSSIRVFQLRDRTVTAFRTSLVYVGYLQTVRNRLREHGIRARPPYFGAVLQRQHRRAMVRWCNTVRMWNLANWRRVWFSDESRFMHERRDGRVGVYRRRNERFAPNCVVEVDDYGGGSVMVWGAISYARKHS